MNIAVIGTGYAGLVTGVSLAEIGNNVTCLDIDRSKISMLQKGKSPIYEKGLEKLLKKNIKCGRLTFTSNYQQGLTNKQIIYIAVGTPEKKDGSADLSSIEAVCNEIAASIGEDTIIVTKSTVPVGTNEYMEALITKQLLLPVSVTMVSNPEFLRQGSAVHDTFHGDRIVIGSNNPEALDVIEKVNQPFQLPIIRTDLRSAEMIKYASNAFLAAKISYINEISKLCESVGANVENVAAGMGMDRRIGSEFLDAGVGYGGSCFPKDTNALISIGKIHGLQMHILESVQLVNQIQRSHLVNMIRARFGSLYNKKAAILGLTFKADTDDMRDAPSIQVINELISAGAKVSAYDPVAAHFAKHRLSPYTYCTDDIEEALNGADFAVILTNWNQIVEYDLNKYSKLLNQPIIFDGRNCFSIEDMERNGIEYHSIGRPVVNAVEKISRT